MTAVPRPFSSVPTAVSWPLPADFHTLDFLSDLHLQASEPATVQALRQYLDTTQADAVFLLGDLFEVWVGDDALLEADSFEAQCATLLRHAASTRPLFFMQGNRDFLTGERFDALCGTTTLNDPTVIDCGDQRLLLSHGDALCLDDVDYQRFRSMARSETWQRNFLSQPLALRRQQARGIRAASESLKRQSGTDPNISYADLDSAATRRWLQAAQASILIHGHTHRPADHDLGDGLQRRVLSDWDLSAQPPRADVLRWRRGQGLQRLSLPEVLAQAPSSPDSP